MTRTRDLTKEEWEDLQDHIFTDYPDKVNSAHAFLYRVLHREPRPAEVVNRFKLEHPELWAKEGYSPLRVEVEDESP